MKMLDKLIALLEELHGEELNLKKEMYYVFLKDGLFSIYYDEDEEKLKVNVMDCEEGAMKVYRSDSTVAEMLKVDE